MKKLYTLSSLFFLGILIVGAQITSPPIIGDIGRPYPTKINKITDKTVNCIDSVRYPQSKLTGVPEVGSITYNASLYQGISQAYHLNTSATIRGIGAYLLLDFDGVPGNFAPVNAEITVYNIDAQNYPTTVIGSAMVQVVDVGFQEQVLMFSSPIAVSDSFAIAIEMDSTFNVGTDTIFYATNVCGWNGSICTVADGNGEGLSCISSPDFVSANGSGWFHNNIEVFGWDIDYLMHPIIDQNFSAQFTTLLDEVCFGQPITFTNNSVLNTVPMFNQYGVGMPLWEWDFGDGTGIYNPFDTAYVYPSFGAFTAQLKINYYGYDGICSDSMPSAFFPNLIVADTVAVANFGWTDMGSGNFQFSDSSIVNGGASYSWTFQGGTPGASISASPLINFGTPGNYQACLTVTDSTGCATDVFCDSISFTVGIDDFYAADYVKVYPIPANKFFNVVVPNNYFNGKVVITDVVGQQLKIVAIENQEKIKVTTEGIASGVYFVSIEHNNERVFTKRIVIDR